MIRVLVDGQYYPAKYIGKGAFSKVFRVENRVVYYTRGDCGKEVLAMFQYERTAHLPELIRHDNVEIRQNTWYVFSSPYYKDVKRTDTSAWYLMSDLIRWTDYFRSKYYNVGQRGIDIMHSTVDEMSKMDFPRSVIKAMREIVDLASNCGHKMYFDFHKKNFGVNRYGTLIFRDPMYEYM